MRLAATPFLGYPSQPRDALGGRMEVVPLAATTLPAFGFRPSAGALLCNRTSGSFVRDHHSLVLPERVSAMARSLGGSNGHARGRTLPCQSPATLVRSSRGAAVLRCQIPGLIDTGGTPRTAHPCRCAIALEEAELILIEVAETLWTLRAVW